MQVLKAWTRQISLTYIFNVSQGKARQYILITMLSLITQLTIGYPDTDHFGSQTPTASHSQRHAPRQPLLNSQATIVSHIT